MRCALHGSTPSWRVHAQRLTSSTLEVNPRGNGLHLALLSISEVAAATGLRPSALRYYEDEGLIASSARVGGRRHYEPATLRRLAIISLCQEAGFTVAEIRDLLNGSGRGKAWRGLAERKVAEIDARIERARAARELLGRVLACGCEDPARCAMVSAAAERRLLRIETRPPS